MYKSLAIGTAAGALLGSLAYGGLVASAEQAAKNPPPSPEQVAATACESEVHKLQTKVDGLKEQMDATVARMNTVRSQRASRLGQTLDWPDDLPDSLQHDAIEDHVLKALEGTSGRLLDVDCEHYPCVAVMGWTHSSDEDPDSIRTFDGRANIPGELLAKLVESGEYASMPHFETGRMMEGATGETLHSIMWFPADEFRKSKHPENLEQARQDGTRIDQISGRLNGVTEKWKTEGMP